MMSFLLVSRLGSKISLGASDSESFCQPELCGSSLGPAFATKLERGNTELSKQLVWSSPLGLPVEQSISTASVNPCATDQADYAL